MIHEDQATGATTHLYELETIVPTLPAYFADLERVEELYFYRKLGAAKDAAPEFIAARPSLVHTNPETGESYQTYAVSRPKGANLFYLDETELAARYRLVPKSKAKDWWNGEVGKIPPFVSKTVFLLSGALIPVWRQIKNVKDAAFKIVRTTTDEGVRPCRSANSPNPMSKKSHGFSIARGFRKKPLLKFTKTSSLAKNHSNLSKIFASKIQNSSAIFTLKSFRAERNIRKSFALLDS